MSKYVFAVLLVMVCVFGYVSYSAHEKIGQLTAVQVTLEKTIADNEQAIKLAGMSCKTGQEVTKSVSGSINKLQDGMTKQLEGLAAISATTLQGNTNDASKATTGPHSTVSDNARISPELKRLLDDAYCANADDSSCTAQ